MLYNSGPELLFVFSRFPVLHCQQYDILIIT